MPYWNMQSWRWCCTLWFNVSYCACRGPLFALETQFVSEGFEDHVYHATVAQLVRAPACHAGGYRFKSGRSRKSIDVISSESLMRGFERKWGCRAYYIGPTLYHFVHRLTQEILTPVAFIGMILSTTAEPLFIQIDKQSHMEQDQQFLDYVVKALVDHPEDVKIDRSLDELGVFLKLSVHRDDMGKIIGRSGATAKAIRTILRVVGMKNDARVNLKIEEPEGGTHTEGASAEAVGPIDTSVDELIDELKGSANA